MGQPVTPPAKLIALREVVAIALFNKGVALSELGRDEEAITVYDDVLSRFGSATELTLREQAARAIVNKAATLNELGHNSKAIAVCDDLLARLASASDLPLGELVAMALVIKGDALGTLGQNKNAIAVLDDMLARFDTATEPPLSDLVVDAKFCEMLYRILDRSSIRTRGSSKQSAGVQVTAIGKRVHKASNNLGNGYMR
jgi:tetratricopeptide (TPR) repeat protein